MTQPSSQITKASLLFDRFVTLQGNPTCAIDVSTKKCCEFLGLSHFGTRPQCLYPNAKEPLRREPDNLGGLVPHKTCPMWVEQHLDDAALADIDAEIELLKGMK